LVFLLGVTGGRRGGDGCSPGEGKLCGYGQIHKKREKTLNVGEVQGNESTRKQYPSDKAIRGHPLGGVETTEIMVGSS